MPRTKTNTPTAESVSDDSVHNFDKLNTYLCPLKPRTSNKQYLTGLNRFPTPGRARSHARTSEDDGQAAVASSTAGAKSMGTNRMISAANGRRDDGGWVADGGSSIRRPQVLEYDRV